MRWGPPEWEEGRGGGEVLPVARQGLTPGPSGSGCEDDPSPYISIHSGEGTGRLRMETPDPPKRHHLVRDGGWSAEW